MNKLRGFIITVAIIFFCLNNIYGYEGKRGEEKDYLIYFNTVTKETDFSNGAIYSTINLFFLYKDSTEKEKYITLLSNNENWEIMFSNEKSRPRLDDILADKIQADTRVKELAGKELDTYKNIINVQIIIGFDSYYETEDCKADISFLNNPIKDNIALIKHKERGWQFGRFSKKDFNFKRLAESDSKFTLEYGINMNIAEYSINEFGRKSQINFGLGFSSDGILANKKEIKNGSQTSIDLGFYCMYVLDEYNIYDATVTAGYQAETKSDFSSGQYFDLVNKGLKVNAIFDIPYTDRPFTFIHNKTGYFRRAVPMRINFEYLLKGKDAVGNSVSSRYDFGVSYEGAFSKYLIVKMAYNYSKFIDDDISPLGNTDYFSMSYGMELSVLGDLVPILKSILKTDNDKDKNPNYLYFKVENGRKPPLFQPGNQQSLGFALFF